MSYIVLQNLQNEELSPNTLASLITMNSGKTLQNIMNNLEKDLLLEAHPIGTIYITTSKTSPQTIMGGTWNLICTDKRGLLSSGNATPTYGGDRITINFSNGEKGIYEVIYNHKVTAGVFTTSAFTDQGTPTSGKFSRVSHIGDFYNNNNEIEFLMYTGNKIGSQYTGRWIQKGNFLNESYPDLWGTETVLGYRDENDSATNYLNGLYVPWKGKNFWGGLCKSRNENCDALGNPSKSQSLWWYPIGLRGFYDGGIPFADIIADEMTLLVRVDNIGTTFNIGSSYGENTTSLELSQIPCHSHMIGRSTSSGGTRAYDIGGGSLGIATERTMSTGGNLKHNNMQPYITAYIWERIK